MSSIVCDQEKLRNKTLRDDMQACNYILNLIYFSKKNSQRKIDIISLK